MKKTIFKVVALLLCLAVLLSGCSLTDWAEGYLGVKTAAFADMTYTRPDMDQFQQKLDAVYTSAQGDNLDQLIADIEAFLDAYDWFYTYYNLAMIHYSIDMTDSYWKAENDFCMNASAMVDAGWENMLYALAASSFREALEQDAYFGEDYFDGYDGESVWDETFTSMMEQEAALQSRYNELLSQMDMTSYGMDGYSLPMEELFVELVALRQQMAAYAGYDSYPQFAYDFYHYRDYTAEDGEKYLQSVAEYLAEPYREVTEKQLWLPPEGYCSQQKTLQYVQSAAQGMGGPIAEAFEEMQTQGLYDISYGENKYETSFELYLMGYHAPFVYLYPYMDMGDQLIFAHEFGHFVNDYVCAGSYAGADVAEVHSQAMEYLSLCYGEGGTELESYKLADGLCVYVEQAAYGMFEHQVYKLQGEALTVENVRATYQQVIETYGLDSWGADCRDYVLTTHYFSSPMYLISYVLSNDLAVQIYQMELEEPGAGLKLYEECLYSGDSYLLYFAETYGLENPFLESRLESVRTMVEEKLLK